MKYPSVHLWFAMTYRFFSSHSHFSLEFVLFSIISVQQMVCLLNDISLTEKIKAKGRAEYQERTSHSLFHANNPAGVLSNIP